MKCESCNKKLATVHLTEIIENEKKERHFCEDCAQNVTNHFPKAPSPSDILTSLINQVSPEIREMSKTTCPDAVSLRQSTGNDAGDDKRQGRQ